MKKNTRKTSIYISILMLVGLIALAVLSFAMSDTDAEVIVPPQDDPTVIEDDRDDNTVAGGCVVGGCSGQLCGEVKDADELISTCEWREEYACYQDAVCERQTSGECGWTETDELTQCLGSANSGGGEVY